MNFYDGVNGEIFSQMNALSEHEQSTTEVKMAVARSYNEMAEAFAQFNLRIESSERERVIQFLFDHLPCGSKLLDLGCGNGLPATRKLAQRFDVTGLDFSEEQLIRARENVPGGTFINADMTSVSFPTASFSAVTAFFSIFHVPRAEHPELFMSIANWLSPGGYFLACFGYTASELEFDPNWFGAPMYWSNYDADTIRTLIERTGMAVVRQAVETIEEDGEASTFVWMIGKQRG